LLSKVLIPPCYAGDSAVFTGIVLSWRTNFSVRIIKSYTNHVSPKFIFETRPRCLLTDENISFFLIKIEIWQIDGSNPAPKFEIMVSPNEWAKAIKTSPANGELTDTKLQQLDFWNKFKNSVRKKDTRIRLRTPRPQHWYNVSMGSSDAHVALTINSRENMIGCEIYIIRSKELFNFLRKKKDEIEKEIGETIEWVDAAVASRIKIKKEVSRVFDQVEAEKYFAWLYDKTILFQKIFSKYFKEFKNSIYAK
jgi:hypothetical protein